MLEGGCRYLGAAATTTLAQMLVARCDLEPQMGRGVLRIEIAPQFIFPRPHPTPQHAGVDPQRVAHGVEGECVMAFRAARDPSLGVDKKHAFAGISRCDALLIDVNRVGQQREHQALLTGQAMAAGNIEVLARQNLIQADETFDRGIGAQLKAFRHRQNSPGS